MEDTHVSLPGIYPRAFALGLVEIKNMAKGARGDRSDPAQSKIPSTRTLEGLGRIAADCKACDLWKRGTQTVFGEGAPDSKVMFVGEVPGDQEDLAGKPLWTCRIESESESPVGTIRLGAGNSILRNCRTIASWPLRRTFFERSKSTAPFTAFKGLMILHDGRIRFRRTLFFQLKAHDSSLICFG